MSTSEAEISKFFGSEITVALSKSQLQRLHDVLKEGVSSDPAEAVQDRYLVTYLAWVLSQYGEGGSNLSWGEYPLP